MSSLHDLVHRVLDAHLTEAQPAELGQCMPDIAGRDIHLFVPHLDAARAEARTEGLDMS
jgi:hypothetical protein